MRTYTVVFLTGFLAWGCTPQESQIEQYAASRATDLPAAQGEDALFQLAQNDLESRLNAQQRGHRAKNVILMVADGLDPTTVTAARIFEGQKRGEAGEENYLAFERFEHLAMAKTYTTDFQVPDSAGTMTAMMTGVKTRSGVINYGPNAVRGLCPSAEGNALTPLSAMAEDAGLMTGVVSTARLTHATPAAVFAKAVDRGWEADGDLSETAREAGCQDIAKQLLDFPHGDGVDVVLGGGRANFLPDNGEGRGEGDEGAEGRRTDGLNIPKEWQDRSDNHTYLTTTADIANITAKDRPLGLFSASHMDYALDRDTSPEGQPSLGQMTEAAIKILEESEAGYFLVVEAGRVDHAHHAGNAARALADATAFSDAVRVARDMTNRDDTLIIATADHGHTLTISGYPIKGNSILGLASQFRRAADDKSYTTLNYANGPGAKLDEAGEAIVRSSPDANAVKDKDYIQQALIPMYSETHGGQDVGIYADGPGAFLFTGTVEQNYIFHVIAYALGFDTNK